MAKLPEHENCPKLHDVMRRGVGYYQSPVTALYQRDPTTRKFKMIGRECRLCGAVKMDDWTAWVKLTNPGSGRGVT